MSGHGKACAINWVWAIGIPRDRFETVLCGELLLRN